jgi:hypothetical protein
MSNTRGPMEWFYSSPAAAQACLIRENSRKVEQSLNMMLMDAEDRRKTSSLELLATHSEMIFAFILAASPAGRAILSSRSTDCAPSSNFTGSSFTSACVPHPPFAACRSKDSDFPIDAAGAFVFVQAVRERSCPSSAYTHTLPFNPWPPAASSRSRLGECFWGGGLDTRFLSQHPPVLPPGLASFFPRPIKGHNRRPCGLLLRRGLRRHPRETPTAPGAH